jgi:hypothetical protein
MGGSPRTFGIGHPYTWILILYNAVYWIPMVLPWTSLMSYRQGVVGLVILIGFRATANVYRNNRMTFEQAEVFPLRIP